jgi:Fe-S cluster biogenesis protein NfuA
MAVEQSEELDALTERVVRFLRMNFPQIAMHGGSAAIQHIDTETGEVWIQLSGTCGGCGISPLTVQAIQNRLPMEISEVTTVYAETTE